MDNLTAKTIRDRIELINKTLFADEPYRFKRDISLLGGNSGFTLYLALLFQYEKDEDYKQKVISNIYENISIIENSEELLGSFCGGIAGLGWLLIYLRDNGLTQNEFDEYIDEIEDVLESAIYEFLKTDEFDLLHGAMGLGICLLKSKKHAAIIAILEALSKTCITSESEYKWQKFDKHRTKEYLYDFGVAHGNAGIHYFITKCYREGIMVNQCEKLLIGNLNFFVNNIQDINSINSFFPTSVKVSEYSSPKVHSNYSRLAWCYGDLGILYTLLNSSILLKKEELESKFIGMLHRTADRVMYDDTDVNDAGMCHGSSGVGYIYLKLFQLTNDTKFKNAFEFWLNKSLDWGNEFDGIAGYLFDMGSMGGRRIEYSFLTGVVGVATFLVSALHENKKLNWDECMFLS